MNTLCGHKISIVTPSPQTTRNRVLGNLTDPRAQLLFMDTPGYHLSDKKHNLQLKSLSVSALESRGTEDLKLFLFDKPEEGEIGKVRK